MRISDWSSDVCSSDPPYRDCTWLAALSELGTLHRKVRSAKAPEEERQRSPHSALTGTSIRRNKHGTGQGIGMTPELNNGACIAPKFVLTRSEEHTSELQ